MEFQRRGVDITAVVSGLWSVPCQDCLAVFLFEMNVGASCGHIGADKEVGSGFEAFAFAAFGVSAHTVCSGAAYDVGLGQRVDKTVAMVERDALERCQSLAADILSGSVEADGEFQGAVGGGGYGEIFDGCGSLDRGRAVNLDVVDVEIEARGVADMVEAEIAAAARRTEAHFELAHFGVVGDCGLEDFGGHAFDSRLSAVPDVERLFISACQHFEAEGIDIVGFELQRRSDQPVVHRLLEAVRAFCTLVFPDPCLAVFVGVDDGEKLEVFGVREVLAVGDGESFADEHGVGGGSSAFCVSDICYDVVIIRSQTREVELIGVARLGCLLAYGHVAGLAYDAVVDGSGIEIAVVGGLDGSVP